MFQQIEVFTRLLLSIQWVRTLMREMNGLDDLHLSFEMCVMIPFHVLFFCTSGGAVCAGHAQVTLVELRRSY